MTCEDLVARVGEARESRTSNSTINSRIRMTPPVIAEPFHWRAQ